MFKVRMPESDYTKPWKLKNWNLCLQSLWLWQVHCLHPLWFQKNKILVNFFKRARFCNRKITMQFGCIASYMNNGWTADLFTWPIEYNSKKFLICRYRLDINSKCWQMASERLQVLPWENGKRRKYIAKASLPTFILLPLVRV